MKKDINTDPAERNTALENEVNGSNGVMVAGTRLVAAENADENGKTVGASLNTNCGDQNLTTPTVPTLTGDWNGGPFTVNENGFKFKSLSAFSANPIVGCMHGCPHCYVGEIVLKQSRKLAEFGVADPDGQWGEFALLRDWDEKKFLASLKKAEAIPGDELNADGNRAIMFSTTTDAYQVFRGPNHQELNRRLREMIRRALMLILEKSTLNVRVLTRSPLAKLDFDIYKQFGDRLMLGMSLPTLDNQLSNAYEPDCPAPTKRLEALKAAQEQGLNVYVALAPLFPECDETDIRRTLQAVKAVGALTIFVEPINVRADNVARIAAVGRQAGRNLRVDVFASPENWRQYAFGQLKLVQSIAREIGVENRLHLWPDPSLTSKGQFLKMRKAIFKNENPDVVETKDARATRKAVDQAAFEQHAQWIEAWHMRISEWPGIPRPTDWKIPALPNTAIVAQPIDAETKN